MLNYLLLRLTRTTGLPASTALTSSLRVASIGRRLLELERCQRICGWTAISTGTNLRLSISTGTSLSLSIGTGTSLSLPIA